MIPLADYHVHTTFCDGKSTPAEMVEAALAQADEYRTDAGDYRLTCTRVGQSVTFVFENALMLPADPDPITPEEDDVPDEEEDALIG